MNSAHSDNIGIVLSKLGHRMLQLEAMLRNGSENIREIADEYEGTVATLRQANAIKKIFENPSSSTGSEALRHIVQIICTENQRSLFAF